MDNLENGSIGEECASFPGVLNSFTISIDLGVHNWSTIYIVVNEDNVNDQFVVKYLDSLFKKKTMKCSWIMNLKQCWKIG